MWNTVWHILSKGAFLFILAMVSCKKAEDRRCFKAWGEESERTIPLPSYDKLKLYTHMEFELVQDTADFLLVKAGKNMLNNITWEMDDNKTLSVFNRNSCKFLRGYKRIVKVEVHFKKLINLWYEGTEPLTCRDTINTDFFSLLIRDGAGPVKIEMNAQVILADISHGWGDYTLSGKTNFARIAARSNGFCDTRELKITDSLEVSCETAGSMKIRANAIPMNVYLIGDGTVFYSGQPSIIYLNQIGKGKLVKAE